MSFLQLNGGTEKPGNVRQGWQDPRPSTNSNEASCQSGSIVFPVNPAVLLLSNQDIQRKDTTKVSCTHCSLATEEEVQQSYNCVIKPKKVDIYLSFTTLHFSMDFIKSNRDHLNLWADKWNLEKIGFCLSPWCEVDSGGERQTHARGGVGGRGSSESALYMCFIDGRLFCGGVVTMSHFHKLWANPNMSVVLESVRAAGSPQSHLLLRATGKVRRYRDHQHCSLFFADDDILFNCVKCKWYKLRWIKNLVRRSQAGLMLTGPL